LFFSPPRGGGGGGGACGGGAGEDFEGDGVVGFEPAVDGAGDVVDLVLDGEVGGVLGVGLAGVDAHNFVAGERDVERFPIGSKFRTARQLVDWNRAGLNVDAQPRAIVTAGDVAADRTHDAGLACGSDALMQEDERRHRAHPMKCCIEMRDVLGGRAITDILIGCAQDPFAVL
jgi:hypothetical protein